ncbi:hypothetical protein HX37_26020 [Salmonella enterica]|uniref:Uncharacterized protein n=1 Tax=Salmonella enterica TaxID=28901 RepID=A0A5U2F9A3_SALER|nr:hypothetical protein [Salmonella enterica]
MNLFSKVGIFWLLFLVVYCTALIPVVLFICQLGASTIFFIKDEAFLFSWEDALYIALKKGSIAGVVLGVGVWLKNKLHERHRK